MNWGELATSLMEDLGDPVVILDAAGMIRAVNPATERRLGRTRDALVGQRLGEVMVGAGIEELVAAGLAGDAQRGELVLRLPSGTPIHVVVRMALALDGGQRALVCAFERALPRWQGSWLEIRTDDEFGTITATQGAGESALIGQRCHRVVAGLDAPCTDCPLPLLTVRGERSDVQVLPTGRLLQRKIYRSSATTAQVIHEPLTGAEVARLLAAKLDATAARAGLSAREREVLQQLLTGLTLEDIAAVLGITERTVRFHQANLLAKLGITSRLELVQMFREELESEHEEAP